MYKLLNLTESEIFSFLNYIGFGPKNNFLAAKRLLKMDQEKVTNTPPTLFWSVLHEEDLLVAFNSRRLVLKRVHPFLNFGNFDKRKFITRYFWDELENVSLEELANECWLEFSVDGESYRLRFPKAEFNQENLPFLKKSLPKKCAIS